MQVATKKVKTKQVKMIQNYNKKKKYKRDQLNFKTPPPMIPFTTLDPNMQMGLSDNSFQNFSEEPDFNSISHSKQKSNLNILKESISKLSYDFAADRQYLENLKQKNNRNNQGQFAGSPFIRSMDAFTFDQNDSTLPMINQSSVVRKSNIKSPVMESIRMSRQNKSNAFASLQKYRGNDTRENDEDTLSEGSQNSKSPNLRASYISRYDLILIPTSIE